MVKFADVRTFVLICRLGLLNLWNCAVQRGGESVGEGCCCRVNELGRYEEMF